MVKNPSEGLSAITIWITIWYLVGHLARMMRQRVLAPKGIAYVKNAHVRIDVAYINAQPRTMVWAEFLGCLIFAVPYLIFAIYFSVDFTWISWVDMEGSASSNGLPYRWIPKAFITLGLILLLAAVISVWMRTLIYLWGPERLRDRACIDVIKHHHGGVV